MDGRGMGGLGALPLDVSHAILDKASLEMARRVAAEVSARPELIDLARANLDRWSDRNRDAPGLLRCYAEWRAILEKPVAEVLAILTAETDEGQRLRQNTPFAGVLSPQEVWDIKRRVREEAAQNATLNLQP